MKKNDIIKTLVIGLVSVIVFVGAMIGINFYTGPLIEKNNQGALYEPAFNVFEGAEGFEDLTKDLKDVPDSVLSVFKETSGKGYVFRVNGKSKFSGDPFEVSVGVTSEGKILKVNLDKTDESKELAGNVLPSFVGQDGTLSGVEITGGTTFTATAIKNAVAEGFAVLVANDLIKEAVKTPEQILTELIPTVHTGMSSDGVLKATAITNVSGNIASGYVAENNSGFALIMNKGEEKILVVTNIMGYAKAYNVEGTEVTADNAELVAEAVTYATANKGALEMSPVAKFTEMMPGAANFTEVKVELLNTLVYATKFDVAGTEYYGFYSRSYGYKVMDVFVVLDTTGKVAKFAAKSLFIDDSGYIGTPGGFKDYEDKFTGVGTPDELNDNKFLVTGATASTTSMKQSVKDAFDAFATLNVGGDK